MLYLCDVTLKQDHGEVVHILSSADATSMNHDGALPHELTILAYVYHGTLTDQSSVLCNVYQYI